MEKVFDDLGAEVEKFYQQLKSIKEVWFSLSFVQQQKFNDYFAGEKQKMKELNADLYNASTHRLFWGLLRIAMILTALRYIEVEAIPERVECSDVDFDIALAITITITHHNDYIFNVLNKGITEDVKVSETYSSATRTSHLSILQGSFTSKDMLAAALKIGKSIRTVERHVRRAI